ncbi:MAG: DUF2442 domain-containing protein [Nitrosomonadales bacterium]|nr:DUF2442 domain-containing protein [Nitrosomonadales bacterium]
MRIVQVISNRDWSLLITANDGRVGKFDVRPYLSYEAFEELNDLAEFMKISNGGYFVEWKCGADISSDTIEAKMTLDKDCQGK